MSTFRFKHPFYSALLLIFLLLTLVIFLLTTSLGLQLTVKVVSIFLPGKLHIEQIEGRLIDSISFKQLDYKDHKFSLKLNQVNLHWQLQTRLRQLTIKTLTVDKLDLTLTSSKFSQPNISKLPFNLIINNAHIYQAHFKNTVTEQTINNIQLHSNLSNQRWQFDHINFSQGGMIFQVHGHLEPRLPYKLSADLQFQTNTHSKQNMTGYLHMGGDLALYYWHGEVNQPTTLTLNGTLRNGLELSSFATWHQLKWPLNEQIELETEEGKLHIKGFLPDLTAELTTTLRSPIQTTLNAQGSFNPEKQSLQGELHLNVPSLAFLEHLSTDISHVQGQLRVTLKANGPINKPSIEGVIHLDHAKAVLPKWGLELNPIQAHIKSQGQHWEAKGSINSQGKSVLFAGKGNITPHLNGAIHIQGNQFPLIKTEEYNIHISPQLMLTFSPDTIDLTGTVLVPTALIQIQSFNKTVSLSEDVVFVGAKSTTSLNPLNINTDIQLEMGNDVALDVKGLRGFLVGAIHLHQQAKGPLNAKGELNIRQGTYQVYGQNLTLDKGQLLFTNDTLDKAGINILAVRHFNNTAAAFTGSNQLFDFNSANLQAVDFGNNTSVGIHVTGRLKSPKIQLFSDPSTLSQADILSILLLGKPADQANKAGGQLLLGALSSMKLGHGTGGMQLLDQLNQLKQDLGIDVNIQNTTQYNQQTNQLQENKAVVVGKSFSKRLYLSYNFGLAQTDVNVLTLTYLLNKFLSIQINASMIASGIDLLYTPSKINRSNN